MWVRFLCLQDPLKQEMATLSSILAWRIPWMISFMLTSKHCVGSSGFTLPLSRSLGSTRLIFCDHLDCSPPGSSVPGISQVRTLEWFAISFCRGSFWPKDWTCGSCIDRRILYRCPTWLSRKDSTCITEPKCGCWLLNHWSSGLWEGKSALFGWWQLRVGEAPPKADSSQPDSRGQELL